MKEILRLRYFIQTRTFLGVLFFIIPVLSFAQFPQLYFENITTQTGLSSNDITCIYQDNAGFLWIGTRFGLNKYDGNIFQTFYNDEKNANSISGNIISAILEDKQGVFWIATKDGGLTRYEPSQTKEKQFMQFRNIPGDSNSIASNRLNCLYDYNDAYLLIGAENVGAIFLNKKTFQFTYQEKNTYSNQNEFILNPAAAKKKHPSVTNWLHYVTSDSDYVYTSFLNPPYVFITDKKTGKNVGCAINYKTLTNPKFEVDNDTIWMASWSHGLYYEPKKICTDTTVAPMQYKVWNIDDEITDVISWNRNILLAATKSNGIYFINKRNYTSVNYAHDRSNKFSLASNKVNCVFKDNTGIWWIGTANGLSKYNPAQWQFRATAITNNYDKENIQFSIYEDDANTLRICTSDGIYKKRTGEKGFTLIPFTYKVGNKYINIQPAFIYKLNNDKYFLCSEYGIYNYTPEREKISQLNVEKLWMADSMYDAGFFTGREIYQVRYCVSDTVNGEQVIYFAALGWGMGIYNLTDKTYYDLFRNDTIAGSIKNNLTQLIYKDKQKNIWVGTADGLYKWNKSMPAENNFTEYVNISGNENSISNNHITGILADEKNNLWITTLGGGLNEFDGNKFTRYTPAYITGKTMNGIYADTKGNYWIPTPEGFEVFNTTSKTFQHITLPNSEWILKSPAKILQRSNDEFMYAAGNYIITFNPESFYYEKKFPSIYLTDFKTFDESIYQTPAFNNLNFKYNKNFFTIDFSSLQLSQPSTIKYIYKLDGLNDKWIDAGNKGKATFTSLPPGNYTFKVKVTNPQGEWSEEKNLITFTVLSPFWMRWWFYVLLIIFLAGLTWLLTRIRVNQLLKLQTMRNKIANDLHDDVGSALSTINLYSEVAKMISSESTELKTILDKISVTSQEIQENMSDIVWSLQPRNDNFEHILLRLKNYALETLQAKNIKTQFSTHEKLPDVNLSPEQRKELFLIFKEAITNIIKYANCDSVKINFEKSRRQIKMQISDNGTGFKMDGKFTGNGLHTMHERAKSLDGKLTVYSKPGEGTSIELTFNA